jgi:hypothetical protein
MGGRDSVYVLGAGMSVGAGIPAMATLTRTIFSERYMFGSCNLLSHLCGFAYPGIDLDMDFDGAGANRCQAIGEAGCAHDACGAPDSPWNPLTA